MSYIPLQRMIVPAAFDLSGTAGVVFAYKMPAGQRITVKGVQAVYTEASVPATTPGVLSVGYQASGGSEVEKGVITSGANAIGAVVGLDTPLTSATQFDVSEGDTLYLRLKTQASGGTTTGAGYFELLYVEQPTVER